MNQEELDIILENHGKWLLNEGGERADLSNIDLNGLDLSGSNLERAYLKNTNLTGANLSNVNMQSTYLIGVNFEEACLTEADLSNATLHCTNLGGANLSGVNLRGANLSGVNLSKADLNWINWQSIKDLTAVVVQVDTTRRNNQIAYIKELDIWTTGCFQGTLDELKASVEKTHKDNEKIRKRYYRVIDFILNEVEEE
ncbi:TPA: pentapeptide repeat-containing protein [Listeria monocytogenes]|nr:pentapeptide repeat-containing protein [Listeria monocytogenes]